MRNRLPQVNARVTKVQRGGLPEDWDREEDEGPAIWSGDVGAYYQEKTRRVTATDQSDVIIDRYLILNSRNPRIDFKTGDVITFRFKNTERKGTVAETEEKELPASTVLGTVRLPLEPT